MVCELCKSGRTHLSSVLRYIYAIHPLSEHLETKEEDTGPRNSTVYIFYLKLRIFTTYLVKFRFDFFDLLTVQYNHYT
jgi:hypothetical protein